MERPNLSPEENNSPDEDRYKHLADRWSKATGKPMEEFSEEEFWQWNQGVYKSIPKYERAISSKISDDQSLEKIKKLIEATRLGQVASNEGSFRLEVVVKPGNKNIILNLESSIALKSHLRESEAQYTGAVSSLSILVIEVEGENLVPETELSIPSMFTVHENGEFPVIYATEMSKEAIKNFNDDDVCKFLIDISNNLEANK